MVAALIDHIEVYHAEKQDGITNQRVDMFAIETHPFISDVSMTFTRYFRSCALFCALLEFSRIFALHVLLSEVAKKS